MRFLRHAAPPPLNHWTRARDLPDPPAEPFRSWWRKR
jgi:L-lactate dehydrogenase complex protein LldF